MPELALISPKLISASLAPETPTDVWADSPWGVNDPNWGLSVTVGQPWMSDALIMIRDMGVQWARVFVVWSELEVVAGTIVWDDTGVRKNIAGYLPALQKAGFKILVTICNPPSHAYAASPVGTVLADPTKYANFVTAFITRFPGMFDAIQIGNEEFMTASFQPDKDPLRYIAILQAGVNAVRALQPTCKIILAANYVMWPGVLEDWLNLGAIGYFDAIDCHPYVTTGTAANVAPNTGLKPFNWFIMDQRRTLDRHGLFDKEIWVTEMNWTRTNEQQTSTIVTAAQQEANLSYMMRSCMQAGVSKFFPYVFGVDDGMTFVHKGDQFFVSGSWTDQPDINMVGNLLIGDTSLTMTPTWAAGRWPASGVLQIEDEQIYYSSYSGTTVSGLVRGYNNTVAAQHAHTTQIRNIDNMASGKRSIYYTYQQIARAYPSFIKGLRVHPPDVPPPGPTLTLPNGDMELKTGVTPTWTVNSWSTVNGQVYSTAQMHSGAGSLRLVTDAGGTQKRSAQTLALPAGTGVVAYVVDGWILSDGTTGVMTRIQIDGLDSGSATVATWGSSDNYVYSTDSIWRYQRIPFVTFSAGNAVTQIKIWLEVRYNPGGSGTPGAWFDDVSISPLVL